MIEDPRKTGLKNGLRQLNIEQLQRIISYPGEMVLDSFNYENGRFCALAIGVGLDKSIIDPSHKKMFQVLTDMGYQVYNTRGISGDFYTIQRKQDLLEAAEEVLEEKMNKQLEDYKIEIVSWLRIWADAEPPSGTKENLLFIADHIERKNEQHNKYDCNTCGKKEQTK